MSSLGLNNKFLKGKFLTNKGKIIEAINLYNDILNKYPENVRAKTLLNELKKNKINKNLIINLTKKLDDCFNNSQWKMALNYCIEILNIDESNSKVWNMCGAIYSHLNQHEKALICLKKYVDLVPESSTGYYNLSLIYIKCNLYDKALESIDIAIKNNSNSSKFFYTKGFILEKIGSIKSVDLYEKALSINPLNVDALIQLGNINQSNLNFEKAIFIYDKVISIDKSNYIAFNNKANALLELGKKNEAIINYEKALTLEPNYSDAINNLALLKKQNNTNETIQLFKKAIEINPNNSDAFNNLANIEFKKGNIIEAIKNYKSSLLLQSNNQINIFLNFYQIIIQNEDLMKKSLNECKMFITEHKNKLYQNSIFLILNSIYNMINNKYDEVLKNLQIVELTFKNKQFLRLTEKEKKFCKAYLIFLKGIQNLQNNILPSSCEEIFHIGNSHCLTFNQQIFNFKNKNYIIKPLITIGGKSYHFANKNNNSYKALTKLNLTRISSKSMVLVSFGEIDCRFDEGIIPAAKKLDLNINDLIDNTVKHYMEWFYKNVKQVENFYFFNVPAPKYNYKIDKKSNYQVAYVVNKFNIALEEFSKHYNFKVIDVYSHTNENKFSNNLFHSDDFHLNNKIFGIVSDQLKKFINKN